MRGKYYMRTYSFCTQCQKEDRQAYKFKHRKSIKEKQRKYMKKWEKENKDKRSEINARYARKRSADKCVDWYVHVNVDGLTQLTHSNVQTMYY